MLEIPEFQRSLFLQGIVGAGKTSAAAQYALRLIEAGANPASILLLVAQPHLSLPYQSAFLTARLVSPVSVTTFSGFARRMLRRFWPLVAESAGLKPPVREPVFLTSEMAQYYLSRFALPYLETGAFDSIHLHKSRLVAQILDNIGKAGLAGLTLDEAQERLIMAWGDRHSTRQAVYRTAAQVSQQYRAYCLSNSLLDYTLQIELFSQHLLDTPAFRSYFSGHFSYLIADNLEEMGALAHDFIFWCLDYVKKSLLICDNDGGYRTFLGADPANAYELVHVCDDSLHWENPLTQSSDMTALVSEMSEILNGTDSATSHKNTLSALSLSSSVFYPQMIDLCVSRIHSLITDEQVQPSQIAVLSSYLDDSLRFILQSKLDSVGIPYRIYRPSRPLHTEPVVKAVMVFMRLLAPEWGLIPTLEEFTHALMHVIAGLDPVRTRLLAQIVYRQPLSAFAQINPAMQKRITTEAGTHYDNLREWLQANAALVQSSPPDYIISRMFDDLLSRPGYRFHHHLAAGRTLAELVNSAKTFRQTLYPEWSENWLEVNREFVQLVLDGIIASHLTLPQHQEDAVFIAPAYTFLMNGQSVDYQFWLDAGNNGWWERLEQPLTHPYVLRRSFVPGAVWTDEMEWGAQEEALKNLLMGLLRRCQKRIYVGISEMSASGYEQRGPVLSAFQELLSRHADYQDNANG